MQYLSSYRTSFRVQMLLLAAASLCIGLSVGFISACKKSAPDLMTLLGKPRAQIEKVCGLPKSTADIKAKYASGKSVSLQTCMYESPLNMYPFAVTYDGQTFQSLTVMVDFTDKQRLQALRVLGLHPQGNIDRAADGKLSPLPDLGDFVATWNAQDSSHNAPWRLTVTAANAAHP